MNIGIFTDSYYPHISGVATSIDMLKKGLEKKGNKVYIVAPNLINNKLIYDKENQILWMPGIKVGIQEMKLTKLYSKKAFNIIKNEWALDIIHSQTEFGVGFFSRKVAKKLNIPIVHTYHTLYEDCVFYVTHGHFDNLAKKLVVKLTKYYCDTKCDELIVPTHKIKYLFNRKYNIKKHMHVIPTGIDIEKFYPNNNEDKIIKIKKKYSINNDTFVIGTVGRIAAEKDFDKMIMGLSEILRNSNDIKLMIVGDGPDTIKLKKIAKEYKIFDKIIFTGMIEYEELPLYYQTFNISISYSTSETQGLTVIESLAAGIPCLCINDDSYKKIIENDLNGYIFNTTEECIQYIEKIKNDKKLYQKLKNNSLESVKVFSSDVFANKVLNVYKIAKKNK